MRGQEYDRVEGGESEGGEQDGEGEREGLTHQHSLANEGLLKFYRGHHDDLSSEITLQNQGGIDNHLSLQLFLPPLDR